MSFGTEQDFILIIITHNTVLMPINSYNQCFELERKSLHCSLLKEICAIFAKFVVWKHSFNENQSICQYKYFRSNVGWYQFVRCNAQVERLQILPEAMDISNFL